MMRWPWHVPYSEAASRVTASKRRPRQRIVEAVTVTAVAVFKGLQLASQHHSLEAVTLVIDNAATMSASSKR